MVDFVGLTVFFRNLNVHAKSLLFFYTLYSFSHLLMIPGFCVGWFYFLQRNEHYGSDWSCGMPNFHVVIW